MEQTLLTLPVFFGSPPLPQPRAHHFVPKAYLAGFLVPPETRLRVFDRVSQRSFSARPSEIGHRRDFYRVNATETNPDEFVLETELFRLVDDYGWKGLLRFAQNPSNASLMTRSIAMSYLALAWIRSPAARKRADEIMDRMGKDILTEAISRRDGWQDFLEFIPPEQRSLPQFQEDVVRRFILNYDGYKTRVDRNWTQGTMLRAVEPFANGVLAPLRWTRIQARVFPFVTSDNPLSLSSTLPRRSRIFRQTAPDTIAVFPLDKSQGLIGLGSKARLPKNFDSAFVNGMVAIQSIRQVFSGDCGFQWRDPEGLLHDAGDFLALGKPLPDPIVDAVTARK